MKASWRKHLRMLAAASTPLAFAVVVWASHFQLGKSGHFPPVVHPSNNAPSEARMELGRKLFFDPVLSVDSTVSCGSCHIPRLAFSDSVAVSPGVEGRLGVRNAPPLFNVGYHPKLNRDAVVATLEMQVLVPVQEHVELDFNLLEIAKRMARDSIYSKLSRKAYDRAPDPFVITRALGNYQRTLVSQDSEWDSYMAGGKLSPQSQSGLKVFMKSGCQNCHSGIHFSDFQVHNNGLKTAYPDSGLARVTTLPQDVGKFKTASLRNLAFTAPYMHDGSLRSLEDVLHHYESGGLGHANQDPLIKPFTLSAKEKTDLIHFLLVTLRDDSFTKNHAGDAKRPIPSHVFAP